MSDEYMDSDDQRREETHKVQMEEAARRAEWDAKCRTWPPTPACNMAMSIALQEYNMATPDVQSPEEIADKVHRLWAALQQKDWSL